MKDDGLLIHTEALHDTLDDAHVIYLALTSMCGGDVQPSAAALQALTNQAGRVVDRLTIVCATI